MSASNFHGIVGSIDSNGAGARGTVRPRGARRAAAVKSIERAAKPAPKLADFVRPELRAQDASMWPIHPVMWLQPELDLAAPAASGLRIERKHAVPLPEFVHEPMTVVGPTPAIEMTVPILPKVDRVFPASGLATLGWDPRVASQAAAKEDQK